jgi:hypothetical protein
MLNPVIRDPIYCISYHGIQYIAKEDTAEAGNATAPHIEAGATPAIPGVLPSTVSQPDSDAAAPIEAGATPALPGAANQPTLPAVPDATSTATTFERLVLGLSGAPVSDNTRTLLQGVKSIRRKPSSVELTKADETVTVLANDTEFGARVVKDINDVKEKLASKFGEEVGKLSDDFVGLTAEGNHFTVERLGPDEQLIELTERPADIKLKRVRFGKIKFNLAEANGSYVLKDIEGIEVVPALGLSVPIEVKEFARRRNADGDDILTVGFKSPVPKPFRMLFGLKELMTFSWTLKHKPGQDIGQVPAGAQPKRNIEEPAPIPDQIPAPQNKSQEETGNTSNP